MNIEIDKELKEKCNVSLGCIFYSALVTENSDELWEYINSEIIDKIQRTLTLKNLTEQINIKTTRQAYRALGKDPSRYRVSSEALIRRILQGKGLYKINSVVDTNNLISIKTGYSVGSFDLENLQGDITFRRGKTGENYHGIGRDEINIENLPVFADKLGAFGSPTRDSTRAMITEKSKNIMTVLISFNGKENLENSIELAKVYLTKYANAKNINRIIV